MGANFDGWDFFDFSVRDVRLSTAILNGARFPIISSSGTLHYTTAALGPSTLHIVDGGYFNAAGVDNIQQIASIVLTKIASSDNLRPIVLLISNDGVNLVTPKVDDLEGSARPIVCRGISQPKNACPGSPCFASVAPDFFGPLQGLYQTRSAHRERLRIGLGALPLGKNGDSVEVRSIDICAIDVPMNWAVSGAGKHLIDDLMDVRLQALRGGQAASLPRTGEDPPQKSCEEQDAEAWKFMVDTLSAR